MPLALNLGAAFNTAANIPLLPWKLTALKTMQDDGTLIKVSDVMSPLDAQASIKITNTRIANVYNTLAKGQIPLQNQSSNTSGQSIFVELIATASETIGTVVVQSPLVARVEIRMPNNGSLTNTDVQTLVLAALASMYDSAGVPQFTNMMRGVLRSTT